MKISLLRSEAILSSSCELYHIILLTSGYLRILFRYGNGFGCDEGKNRPPSHTFMKDLYLLKFSLINIRKPVILNNWIHYS